jgi:folate-binding Fe-S cluster repair protein YgfZ
MCGGRCAGPGRLAFLHNQSTNAFTELRAGQGCDTVSVTLASATGTYSPSAVMYLQLYMQQPEAQTDLPAHTS